MAGGRERGSGTLWTLGISLVLMVAVLALLLLTAVGHTRQLAAVAADMAALSAATALPEDPAGACRIATETAADHRGRLRGCSVRGAEVEVTVRVRRLVLGFPIVAASTARAGPVAVRPSPTPYGQHMWKFIRFVPFITAGTLMLAGCSGPGEDDQSGNAPDQAEQTTDEAPAATEEVLAGGLQAVFETVDGAQQCGGGDISVRTYEGWERTGAQWFGRTEAQAAGPRPTMQAYARFCTPRTDESAVTYLVELQGFGSADEASSWLESLREASATGVELADWRSYTGQPDPEVDECVATATANGESRSAGAAFDVTVDSPCRDTGSPPGFHQNEAGDIRVGEGLETNVDGVEAEPAEYS